MSEFVRFYQGTESDYKVIKDNGQLEDCFYFTETDAGEYNLYLNEHTIFSSKNEENIAQDVINSKTFKTEMEKYLPIRGGTVTGDLNIANTLNVTEGLSVNGNISASNFIDGGQQVIIPCALTIDADTTINGLLTLDNLKLEKGELKNCSLTNITKIAFTDNASLENLPTYTTQAGYEFNFKDAKLTVNSIDAQSITIKNQAVSTQESAVQVFQSIQIGNIILSDDGNGNLAITSVN